jgi:lipopolysaccharide export system protein LptA
LIDLQAKGTPPDDPAKTTASAGVLHLKTSGLAFNEKTGLADTDNAIEFALPQGKGSALGATYDSKLMTLHLKSDVKVHTVPSSAEKKSSGVKITAANADIFDAPREAILSDVHLEDEQQSRSMTAGRLTILLRDDNTIERATAVDSVSGNVKDATGGVTNVQASQAELSFGEGNHLKSTVLTGAVKLESQGGKGDMRAQAGRADLEFGPKTRLEKVRASQAVTMSNAGGQGKQDGFELHSAGVDFFLKAGNRLDRAVTSGAAEVVLDSKPNSAQKAIAHTVATADRFEATFASAGGAKNKMESVHGRGNTKVTSSSAGNPDRITTGNDLLVKFDTKNGAVMGVAQSGNFKYVEGSRNASADRASFDMASDQLTLNGSPRMQDQGQGFVMTADSMKMNRKTSGVEADGEIKATYTQNKAGTGGAIFSGQGGEPVHATSQKMTANKSAGVAVFSGKARLWQGANVIEAPRIEFDKDRRSLTAEGTNAATNQVQTAFVQTDKKGKVTPVSVVAGKLVYSDNERKTRFEGGIRMKTAEMTMVADHADVFLKAKSGPPSAGKDSAGQIDRIEAEGEIVIEEQDPLRKVTGGRLVYTADEGKFVMTGGKGKSPSIFDAERGNLTGDSLTFYTHDDRVQVGSGENSRIVTRTRIKDERKP